VTVFVQCVEIRQNVRRLIFVHGYAVIVSVCYIPLNFILVLESLISEYHTERQTSSSKMYGTVQKMT
jgi:hypothetical protein